ncbi:CST complex subunit Ten1 [Trichoderma evansii]
MSWGPVASQLCLLSQLKERSVGDKVRFLGCVISYDTSTACLNLGHMYPPGTNETVLVDIELVLETIQPGLTQVGNWVNVVGYVVGEKKSGTQKLLGGQESPRHIQALLVWPTGPLDIGRYEKSLDDSAAQP